MDTLTYYLFETAYNFGILLWFVSLLLLILSVLSFPEGWETFVKRRLIVAFLLSVVLLACYPSPACLRLIFFGDVAGTSLAEKK